MSGQDLPIAPGNVNVVVLPSLSFVFLWPSFRPPPAQSPAGLAGTTGTVQNHWHYRPGQLQVNAAPVHWTVQEQWTAATYRYDRAYSGAGLSNLEVDLFRPNGAVDFNDYATMRALYTGEAPGNPSDVASPRPRPLKRVPGTATATFVSSAVADANGRVSFAGVPPGEYVLYLRGRMSFVENASPGGPASSATDRHNGIDVDALARCRARPAQALKVVLDAQGNLTAFLLTTDAQGQKSETSIAAARYLGPEESAQSVSASTPYALYALPLVSASNSEQWRAAVRSVASALFVTEAQAESALSQTPVLDLAALQGWECGLMPVIGQGAALEQLLQSTLLVSASGPATTVAWDHAVWSFSSASATEKTRAWWLPLGEPGFFSGQGALYALASKTRDAYGRSMLRALDPPLEGRDVRELKTRLVLWGSHPDFVDLRNDRFDRALSQALLRFKCNEHLFRLRVDDAHGNPDPARCVITSIVDAETYRALDARGPSHSLAEIADRKDPTSPGIPLLTEQGYCRLILHAAEHARARINPKHPIHVHSSFRTLAHNRHVYLGPGHQLRWRLASDAGPTQIQHGVFTTTIQGVPGADGSAHAAHALATIHTVLDDEPRGTYVGEPGAEWAADYSNHTTGKAFDFDLARGGAVEQIQRDTDAIVLFGASRQNHLPGRIWLEPRKTPAAAGTTDWIHMDNGDLPAAKDEFALTDDDVRGPRWDASAIVTGTATLGGQPRLGARLDLLDGTSVVATTYADREGKYSLRARGIAADAGRLSVRASFDVSYPFQRPETDSPAVACLPVPVTPAFPGAPVTGVDFQLPDDVSAGCGTIKGVKYQRLGASRSILVTCAGWDSKGMGTDASIAWARALQEAALPEVGHLFAVRGPVHSQPLTSYPEIDLGGLASQLHDLCAAFGEASDRLFVVAHSSGSYVAHALFGKLLPHPAPGDRVVYCNVDGGSAGLDDVRIARLRNAFAVSTRRAAVAARNYDAMAELGHRFATAGRGTFVPSRSGSAVAGQGAESEVRWWLHYALIDSRDATRRNRDVYLRCTAANVTSDYLRFATGEMESPEQVPESGVPA